MQEQNQAAEKLPPLSKDIAFYGMTITQFFGAFNDNLYKQLVLILCLSVGGAHAVRNVRDNAAPAKNDPVKQAPAKDAKANDAKDEKANAKGVQVIDGKVKEDVAKKEPVKDYQPYAMFVFAIQFVIFSGIAGFLADKFAKRAIIIICKYAEVGIVLLGMLSFYLDSLVASVAVLGLMGIHSAFFGPSKYGILPEMVHDRDLPPANGVIQMTTFLAIIFGMASAGFIADQFPGELWKGSYACLVFACIGVATSHLVRRTPIAQPSLKFSRRSFVIAPEAWKLVTGDKPLFTALMVYTMFWFIGGLVQPSVNAFGELQMGWSKAVYSSLAACLGFGIAGGCVVAGILSKGKVNFRLVTIGVWGMSITLLAVSLVPSIPVADVWHIFLSGMMLTIAGFFAGFFAVPLQVFLQARPPADKKGQVIGAMNLFTWIGIILSAVFYNILNGIFPMLGLPQSAMFAFAALSIAPIAIFYRPKSADLT